MLTALPTAEHSPDTTKLLSMTPEIPIDQKHTRAAVALYAIVVFRAVRSATPRSLSALKKTKAMIQKGKTAACTLTLYSSVSTGCAGC